MFLRIRKDFLATAAASALLISSLSVPAQAAPPADRKPQIASASWFTSLGDLWEIFGDLRITRFWEKSSSAYDPNGGADENEDEDEGATRPTENEEIIGKSSSAYDPNG